MAIFSKVLSATDVKRRCTVPMKDYKKKSFPKLAGKQKMCFKVEDESNHEWTFWCYTRIEKHPKPVLIGDWIPFVKSKFLCEGDRVTICEERDKTGSMHYKIKVEKLTRPEIRRSDTMNNSDKGSSSHNSDNQSTATFQPSGDLSPHLLNHDLGKTTTTTSSSIDEEKTPTSHSTSRHKSEWPSLSLSLELNPKATVKWGAAAKTNSSIDKEQILNPNSTSQDMVFYKTRPSLNLSLELTLKTTLTEGEQHAYTQGTIPKTVNFLASFSKSLESKVTLKERIERTSQAFRALMK